MVHARDHAPAAGDASATRTTQAHGCVQQRAKGEARDAAVSTAVETPEPIRHRHIKMWGRTMRRLAAALTALVTTALVVIVTPQPAAAAPYVPQASNRSVLNFNTHWLFAGDVPGGAGQAVGLNESGFVPVSLPYYRTHPHKGFPKGDFEVPVSWYRRHFTLPAQYSGRRIAVEFQGVAKIADVYVNGTFVGQHRGAYTSFTYDITPHVNIGGADNVIAVKVDSNTRNDIPPEGGA